MKEETRKKTSQIFWWTLDQHPWNQWSKDISDHDECPLLIYLATCMSKLSSLRGSWACIIVDLDVEFREGIFNPVYTRRARWAWRMWRIKVSPSTRFRHLSRRRRRGRSSRGRWSRCNCWTWSSCMTRNPAQSYRQCYRSCCGQCWTFKGTGITW